MIYGFCHYYVISRAHNTAPDPVNTDPDKYKVIFENDRIRVFDYNDKPGDKTGTYPDPHVIEEMADFIAIKVDTQKRIDIESKYGIAYYPTVIFLDPKGKEISRHVGYLGPEEMVQEIKQSRGKSPKESPGFEVLPVLAALILLAVKRHK